MTIAIGDDDDDEDLQQRGEHSPTELADDDQDDQREDDNRENMQVDGQDIHLGALGEVGGEGGIDQTSFSAEKRKRGRSLTGELKQEEGEEGSPSKRPTTTDAAPVSGRELRELLASHLLEMKGQFGSRITQVEAEQKRHLCEVRDLQGRNSEIEKEIGNLRGRATASEKQVGEIKTLVELHDDRINEVTASLAKLQSDLQNRPAQHGGQQGTNPPLDPWANWHQTHQNLPKKSGHLPRGPVGDSEDGSTLSEEEKRTLIVGGWAQDTKKATIEVESRELLARDEIKNLVDEQVLAVYGPRRSVGSLRFDYRQNESFQSLRDRMWKTIKAIRELAIKFPSARENPDSKPAWASFVKTKEARRRTMLVSQTRRVCIQLAGDTKSDEGGPCKPVAVNADSYDTDWGSGTIWQGQFKIASATHRQPTPNTAVIVMPGGWVNLKAVMDVTGCTETEARCAFEREL